MIKYYSIITIIFFMGIDGIKIIESQFSQNENNDIFDKYFNSLIGEGKATKEGFILFKDFIKDIPEKIRKKIIEKSFDFEDYFIDNGFPNNSTKTEFIKFINEHFIDYKKEIENNNNNNAKKSYLSTYKEIKDILSDSKVFNELLNRLAGLDKGTVDISEITKYLSNLDDNQFKELLNTFKKYDEENGTELYSSFRYTLISLDSSFKSKINVFENNLDLSATSIVDLQGARMKAVADSSLLGEDLYKGGIDASLDITKRPPERFLKNKEGYKLETPLGVRDFYEATVTYEKGKQSLDKQYDKFKLKLDRKNSDLSNIDREIDEIKGHIQEMKNLGEDTSSSEDKLIVLNKKRSILKIEKDSLLVIQESFEKRYKFIAELYKVNLAREVKKYRRTIKEQDEGSLKTLNFIHSIGFDMIPQTDTNKLINQINSGVNINRNDIDLGEGFSLNTNIDLTNGILGFSDGINGTSTREKEIFIRFFNKMLTGNPISPININQALMNPKFQVNDTLIQGYRAELYVGGSFNINETLKNLQKSTKNQNN